jgi:multidrug efflux system outer membrane protein
LVEEALRNNLDIRRATGRILELRSRLVQTRADRVPILSVQGQVQRQRLTVEKPSLGSSGTAEDVNIDSHTLSFPASFEWDLWGRLARAEEASRAELLQAEENRLTVAQSVVAETISLYLQIEALERRLQITAQSIDHFRLTRDVVQRRYERGLTSILDLRQSRRLLAQAEAFLPVLKQDLGVAQQRLSVILGRYPMTEPPRPQEEGYFRTMGPVPPGLPSELLLRRPDIRAAEEQLKALNALIGVAKASRFPRITLTGSYGFSNDQLGDLFQPESDLWTLAFGIAQPLFDAGKLKAGQRGAEARYQQGIAEYAKTVLNAFAEVEIALLTREEQLERRERLLKFLEESKATQEVAQSRYQRGLADYLSVLDAQQTLFQAKENIVLVELAILTNRVALHRALGGGWGNIDTSKGLTQLLK